MLKKNVVRKQPEMACYYFVQRLTCSCLRIIMGIWEQEGTVICQKIYRKLRSLKAIREVGDVKRDVQTGKLVRKSLLSKITSQYSPKNIL